MVATWSFDITGANGGAVLASDIAWKAADLQLTLEGPSSINIEILEQDISTFWGPGTHRLIAKRNGTPIYSFYLTNLGRSGRPDLVEYKASGLGLRSILDWRVVHEQGFNIEAPAPDIVEALLDNAQNQGGGEMGLSMGTVTGSGFPDRLMSYCVGVGIGDAIRELSQMGRGFDWDVNADGEIDIWKPDRGTDTGETIAPGNCQVYDVELDTSDLLTTVTALGDPSDPFGPDREIVRTGLGDVYGRHEVVVDVDTSNHNRLIDAATKELEARAGGRLQLRATWIEGHISGAGAPWSIGDVWLGDRVTADMDAWFGGDQEMRCVQVGLGLEVGIQEYVSQTFDTLVEDLFVEGVAEMQAFSQQQTPGTGGLPQFPQGFDPDVTTTLEQPPV